MLYPESKLKVGWEFFVLAASLFGALEIPLSLVFVVPDYPLLIASRWLLVLVFVLDIVVNFNTAYHYQGEMITDCNAVARRYLRSWFWLDMIAALPLALVLPVLRLPSGSFLRLLKLNHLFKLPSSSRTLQRFGRTSINPAILRLFLLVFWILMAAHIVSCGWIYISGNPDKLDSVSRYILAFYWTITTLTTIGYGDILPSGNQQIAFVVIIELLGAGMYGLIIGNIANLIASIDVAKTQYKEKLEKINTFLKYRDIPPQMQRKINEYYNYLWESRRGYDESNVLQDLPMALKISVSLFLNRGIIEKVPIFEHASEDIIREIIMNLTPGVFTPGDNIVTAGEIGYDMYFISKGSVDVLSADEKTQYATLSTGQFFGEIALLLSMPRTATIKAKEYCDLYRLDKDTFDRVISRDPEYAVTIQQEAERRLAEQEAAKVRQTQEEPPARPVPVSRTPQEILATNTGSAIELKWRQAEKAAVYDVIKKNPDTGKWRFVVQRIRKSTCVDFDFFPERENVYRIRMVDDSGAGPWSDPVVVGVTPTTAGRQA